LGLRFGLILAIAAGLSLGWSLRQRNIPALRIIINIAAAVVFLRLSIALFNSSLFYKEVVLLFAKNGFILIALLSFGSAAGFLVYAQMLGLPLFMCFPLFVKNYSSVHFILIAVCFICWAALLKLKFEGSFTLAPGKFFRRYYSVFFGVALLLSAVVVAGMFFYVVPKPSIKDEGFLTHPGSEDIVQDKPFEQKYYELQDKLQDKVLSALPDLDLNENKSEILGKLSSLAKESADVIEVKKAHQGLVDELRRPGPGLEKNDLKQITLLLEPYVEQKVTLNLKRSKEKIIEDLKNNPFSLKEKFSVLSRVNKIQYTNSAEKLKSWARESKEIVNKSAANAAAKKELKEDLRVLEDWKGLQLYYRQMRAFKEKAASLSGESKNKIDGLISAIEEIDSPSGLSAAKSKARILKYTAGEGLAGLIGEVEGIIDIASDIILSRSIAKAKENLRGSAIAAEELSKKEEALNSVSSMEEYHRLQQDSKVEDGWDKKEDASQDGAAGKQNKLTSIEIIPTSSRMPLGQGRELLAMGIYEDNSRQDITVAAKWLSTDADIVLVAEGKVSSFHIGEVKVYAQLEDIKSNPATIIIEKPRLVAIKIFPADLVMPMNGSASLKAKGTFTNGKRHDITSLVAWKGADSRIVRIARGNLRALRLGNTLVRAEYAGIKSIPVNIKVVITVIWLALLLLKSALIFILIMALLSGVFFALTEERRQRLKTAMSVDPRRFIISLYENARGVLVIFGLRPEESIPPLVYAAMVEEKYNVANNLYLGLTQLFEEAKYSNHAVKIEAAKRALEDYNTFIRILLGYQGKTRLLLKRCLALLLRVPLYI